MSRDNRKGSIRALFSSGATLCLVLTHLCAFSQCAQPATSWLEKLASIETGDAPVIRKISALSMLMEEYGRCALTKDSVYGRIVHRLGDYYRLNGDFEKGIALTDEAVRVNKQAAPGAQRSYLTHSYYNLALFHNLLGLTNDAQLYYDSCVAIGQDYPEKAFIVLMALEKKAFLRFQSGDYEQSINIADQGLVLARHNRLADFEALLLIQKAQAESEIDRIAQADGDIRKAIQILKEHNLPEYLPNAHAVHANILATRKQFPEAIAYYQSAIRQNVELNNTEQAARDLHDLGFLYDKKLNDRNMSTWCYTQALKVLETLQDPYMLAATHNNLGLVNWRNRDYQKALEYYQKAFNSLPIGFASKDVILNPTFSQLQAATNDYIPAALLWNKGDAWLGLYESTKDTTFLNHAITCYRQGDRMVDKMRWNQQGEQSKLYWREKTKDWYASAIEAAYLLDDPSEVFYFMEKSRAVLLNDKLAELGAKNQLPPLDAEREKILRVKLQSLASRVSPTSEKAESIAELWEAQRTLNSFIKELEERYPSYYSYKYDTAIFSIDDLKRNLEHGQTWIEFFTTANNIYALTVNREDANMIKIHFPDHSAVARRILALCASRNRINSNFRDFQQLATEYYKKIFVPLNVSGSRVTISHDEYFLPFELLPTDSLDATSFLIKDHAFSYAYSASHVLKSKLKRVFPQHSLLAIAPVSYEGHLKMHELNGADESIETIHSAYEAGAVLVGNAATKKNFLKRLPFFDIVHLYSHARADSLGNESAIYFYDSVLNLSELQNLPGMRTQLIVLFACNSGVGKAIKGEGIFSLARGFAAAGIPSTVSALWEIDNQATYRLAELFFENLAKGEPSDVALQHAKLAMITKYDKNYELPYYWAGAVLIGKSDIYQASTAGLLSDIAKISLAVLAMAFLLFFISRKRKQEIH